MMKNIVICISIFLFSSCYKGTSFLPDVDPNDLPFYEMDEEFKRFFNPAGEGSSYIYIDTLTGEIDTTIITYFSINYGDYGNNGYVGEGYNISYECTNTQNFRVKLRTTIEYFYHDMVFPFGILSIMKSADGYLPSEVISFESDLTLLDQTYDEVLVLARDDGNSFYERLWFAKDVGIILKETKSGEVYLLKTFELK